MTGFPMHPRVLVAGIGNVLRGDDGFGVLVLEALKGTFADEPSVTLVETGIAGVGLVQHLMDGFDTLIIVDAVQRGAEAGRVLVLEPDLAGLAHARTAQIDMHQTDAEGVMRMASAVGCLPAHVWIVGCEAEGCDDLGAPLSEPVRAAIPEAVSKVRALVSGVLARNPERGRMSADHADPLRQQDEALQILYWLRGEGLLADVGVADLKRFLDGTAEDLAIVLERLVDTGLVRRAGADPGATLRYALTPDGVKEGGRRFADEFADMTKPGHGECGDPECDCHRSGNPADCAHHHQS